MGGVLNRLEQTLGLPKLKEVTDLLSGENGKRLNAILGRLEGLARNRETIVETGRLLQLVKELNDSGALDKLGVILNNLPKGKTGENLVINLQHLLEGLEGKVEKLAKLAQELLQSED